MLAMWFFTEYCWRKPKSHSNVILSNWYIYPLQMENLNLNRQHAEFRSLQLHFPNVLVMLVIINVVYLHAIKFLPYKEMSHFASFQDWWLKRLIGTCSWKLNARQNRKPIWHYIQHSVGCMFVFFLSISFYYSPPSRPGACFPQLGICQYCYYPFKEPHILN